MNTFEKYFKPLINKSKNRASFNAHIQDCCICNEKATDVIIEYYFATKEFMFIPNFYCRKCYKEKNKK